MKIIIVIALMFLSINVYAGWQQGQITQIHVRQSDGLIFFYMSGEAYNKPACSVQPYWMIRDENSVAGKSQLSMLLTAYASGKTVKIIGTGLCARWTDGEDLNTFILK